MAVLACASPLTATDAGRKLSSHPPRCLPYPPPRPCVCHLSVAEPKNWRALVSTALAAAIVSFGGVGAMPSIAELNRFEADMRGEFGIGSAAQFGSADLKKAVHVNENFRRANFTSADMRESNFSGSTFNGAYLEKAVAYKANFSGADLSDTLMDRMVLNEANLTNAVLVRSVLTRSDLAGAIVEGADFSDAVLDLSQKQSPISTKNDQANVGTRGHRSPLLIRAGGGIFNYLYQLKQSSQESGQVKVGGSNILGKLQITWRTNLGEPGRLQTQQIIGTPLLPKDIDLQVVDVPSAIILERPFLVWLKLTNQSERTAGPFEVTISQGSSSLPKLVVVNGIQKLVLQPLEAYSSTEFNLNLIAIKLGVQKISGITICDTSENRMYETLPDVEIFVDSE